MGKFVDCPFCGERSIRSKEHVWAQWLHETVGGQALLEGTHGERIPRPNLVFQKDGDGRYRTTAEPASQYAQWLPNVTVDVCVDCNGGWMSRLEASVGALLRPFLFDAAPVRLSGDDLRAVSTWATKSWMAYALTLPWQQNPFTEAEYRSMSSDPAPVDRSRVWLLHSQGPAAQVAMAIWPTLLSKGPAPDLAATANNTAYAYLACSGVVMVMLLPPEDLPNEMADLMTLPMLKLRGVRRCWPEPRPQYFPLDPVPNEYLVGLVEAIPDLFGQIGLPVEGLTDADAAAVLDEFLGGADPADLRRRWDAT